MTRALPRGAFHATDLILNWPRDRRAGVADRFNSLALSRRRGRVPGVL